MMMSLKNEALLPLFAEVKALLDPYAEGMTSLHDEPGYYDLWSEKDIVIDGRKRKTVYFAGLIVQKRHVGFYFMPVYAQRDLTAVFGPELLATLKGKSCFHLKELTPALKDQIAAALAAGYRLYKERGWV
jgi:hypothetical protein